MFWGTKVVNRVTPIIVKPWKHGNREREKRLGGGGVFLSASCSFQTADLVSTLGCIGRQPDSINHNIYYLDKVSVSEGNLAIGITINFPSLFPLPTLSDN